MVARMDLAHLNTSSGAFTSRATDTRRSQLSAHPKNTHCNSHAPTLMSAHGAAIVFPKVHGSVMWGGERISGTSSCHSGLVITCVWLSRSHFSPDELPHHKPEAFLHWSPVHWSLPSCKAAWVLALTWVSFQLPHACLLERQNAVLHRTREARPTNALNILSTECF